MPKGSVKWFNNVKGYGFIITQDGSEELFAHFSAIAMAGYKTLLAGEIVEFDVQQCDKGLQAKTLGDVIPKQWLIAAARSIPPRRHGEILSESGTNEFFRPVSTKRHQLGPYR